MSDDAIDFSSEGLAKLAEGYVEPEETPAEDVDSDDAETAVAETEAEEATDTPADAEEPADAADAEEQQPGETDDEYATRYAEAQKLIGRQGQELGELRKMVEELKAAQAQPVETPTPEPAFATEWVPTTRDELLDGAADPDFAATAFTFAAQQAPELIPDVLAEVQMHDPALAKRMELEYVTYLADQRAQAAAQQSLAPLQQQRELAKKVDEFKASVGNWDEIQNDVAKIIEEEPDLVGDGTPEQVLRGIKWATRMAQQVRDHAAQQAQAQQRAQGVAQRQQAVVESGTPAAAPVVEEPSDEDAIAAAIFADDKRRRELF